MSRILIDYFESLPASQRLVALRLRELILESADGLEERFKWKVPFYYYFGPLCYLNAEKRGVVLGFYRGAEMEDSLNLFRASELKQVRHIFIAREEYIREQEIREYLYQAMELNRFLHSRARGK
jgi:hypothetical protein